jgi:hypothetical protein
MTASESAALALASPATSSQRTEGALPRRTTCARRHTRAHTQAHAHRDRVSSLRPCLALCWRGEASRPYRLARHPLAARLPSVSAAQSHKAAVHITSRPCDSLVKHLAKHGFPVL